MSAAPQLSVVVPVHNEADNVAPLVGEIVAARWSRVVRWKWAMRARCCR